MRLELQAQIDALLGRAGATDESEANEPELDLPAEIERARDPPGGHPARPANAWRNASAKRTSSTAAATTTTAARAVQDGQPKGGRYKREFGVPVDKAQENFTDPDSRILKRAGGGFDPAYNAQTAVEEAAHIIVAAELNNVAPDANWLLPMIQAVSNNLGELPELGLADAGYRSEGNLQNVRRSSWWSPLAGKARSTPRSTLGNIHTPAAMAAKLQDRRRAVRPTARRKWIAEPPNGWIKNVLGFRQFSLRGLHRVQAEWKLVCMALNLRRMAVLSAG